MEAVIVPEILLLAQHKVSGQTPPSFSLGSKKVERTPDNQLSWRLPEEPDYVYLMTKHRRLEYIR